MEQEQHENLRQEDHDAAKPGEHAVYQQALQQPIGQCARDVGAERADAGIDPVHRHGRPAEDRLEHEEQQPRENHHAGKGMHDERICARGEPTAQRLAIARGVQDLAGPRVASPATSAAVGSTQFCGSVRRSSGASAALRSS